MNDLYKVIIYNYGEIVNSIETTDYDKAKRFIEIHRKLDCAIKLFINNKEIKSLDINKVMNIHYRLY